MTLFGYKPSQIRKALVALLGLVVLVLAQVLSLVVDVIPAQWAAWITIVVGACTTAGVFLAKNAPLIDSFDGGVQGVLVSGGLGEEITARLDDLIQAVKDGKEIRVNIPGPGE